MANTYKASKTWRYSIALGKTSHKLQKKKTGKATDVDDFSGRMLKYLGPEDYLRRAEVVNRELNKPGELSEEWHQVIFTVIPKRGSSYPDTHVKAWRNIAGYSGMAKLVERVVVNRIRRDMEQAGWKLDPALMGGLPEKVWTMQRTIWASCWEDPDDMVERYLGCR